MEIQRPRERYSLIDLTELSAQCGFSGVAEFQGAHRQWVDEALRQDAVKRDERWSEALAIGSEAFVERVKRELTLKLKARHRDIDEFQGTFALRERQAAYSGDFRPKFGVLRPETLRFY